MMKNISLIVRIARFMKQLSILIAILGSMMVAGLALTSTPAMASGTPDGSTPANEGVCDVLKGGTAGLYGLCVAYCEAQDLDIVGDKETPNNKILENYRKKMQAGDPDMPCVKVPCPCWTDAQLASVVTNITNNGGTAATACGQTSTTALIRNTSPIQFAIVSTDVSLPLCRFTDASTLSPTSVRFSGIDPAAAQTCYTQISQACASLP